MKKKIFSLALIIMLTVGIFAAVSLNAAAEQYTSGDYTYTVSEEGTATITAVNKEISGNVKIPDNLGGYTVVGIGNGAFADCELMKSVVIPDSIVEVGESAFKSCDTLISVEMGKGMTYIPRYCFSGSSALEEVVIGENVTIIGCVAFNSCTSLSDITWGHSLETIDGTPYIDGAFAGCTSLKKLYIPDTVKTIGAGAFMGCTDITEVYIGNSVTDIGESAFANCSGIKEIILPDSVETIAGYCFVGCTRLTTVIMGDGMQTIGTEAFRDLSNLKTVDMGSVREIGVGAFNDCAKLSNVTWSDKLTHIWSNGYYGNGLTFGGCTSLTEIHFSDTLEYIGPSVFHGCTGLTEVTFGESLKEVHSSAFAGCTSLQKIELPDTLTNLGEQAFRDCTSIKSVSIGNSVTSIPYRAFSGCTSMETLVMGDNVIDIGIGAFTSCTSLKNITWSNSLKNIWGNQYDVGAFSSCTSLTTLNLPSSVTTIGAIAFAGCTSLNEVVLGEKVNTISTDAFKNCTGLTSVVIPENVTTITQGAFIGCSALEKLYLPADLQTIERAVFEKCTSLSDVYYAGTQEDWDTYLVIDNTWGVNDTILNANIHYDCDTQQPTGEIVTADSSDAFSKSHEITITLWDNAGVDGYYWGTNPDYTKNEYTKTSEFTHNKTISEPGTYFLVVKDINGFVSACETISFHEVTLDANGGAITGLTQFLAVRNEELAPPTPTIDTKDLVFAGWATFDGAEEGSETIYASGNKTYYAIWAAPDVIYNYLLQNGQVEIEENDAFEKGTTVTVTELTNDMVHESVSSLFGKFLGFEFTAIKENMPVQPGKKIKVNFAIPDGFSNNVSVKYVTPEGEMEDVDCEVDGNNRVIRADIEHFSTYVIVDNDTAVSTALLGDINANGEIDSLDYILLKRAYFGTYELDDTAKAAGDINGNGEIDSLDYILLKRAYFGTYEIA